MKLSRLFVTAGLLVSLISGVTKGDVFVGGGFALVDFDDVNSEVGEASGDISIAGDGRTVASINSVTLTNLTHTWIGDLVVTLEHVESGASTVLTSPPDGRSANFNGTYTFLVDAGLQTIDEASLGQGTAFNLASGNYAMSNYGGGSAIGPRTDFAAFDGVSLDGTWRLTFFDFVGGDSGALGGWSFDASAVPEPTSMLLLASVVGLGGLKLKLRRRSEV